MSKGGRKKPITAAEFSAALVGDPEYVKLMGERQAERIASVAAYAELLEPIHQDLAAVGVNIASLRELCQRKAKARWNAAMPTLLHWLDRATDASLREDLVRTLSVPWAPPLVPKRLIAEFESAHDPSVSSLRWAIGNAIEITWDDAILEAACRVAMNREYGTARQMIVVGLGKSSSPNAIPVLLRLLDDEEVEGHAIMALGRLKAAAAKERIMKFLNHPKAWVRKEAVKALEAIGLKQ